jgi:diguanylate cyclase (GGDEF)-like protein
MNADEFSRDDLLRVMHHTFDGIAVLKSSPWRVVFANAAFADSCRAQPDELAGVTLAEMATAPWQDELLRQWNELCAVLDQGKAIAESSFVVGNERYRVKLLRLQEADEPAYALLVQRMNVGQSDNAATQARLDPLTNLPDRSFLLARMETLLHGDRLADRAFAVLFIDLDNFKQANDRFGHIAGDRILKSAAERLRNCVRESDHVVRFGGDEFVVLLEGIAERADVEPVIERIGQAFLEPFDVAGEPMALSLSIGVALASPVHTSPDDVLSEADTDMYAAKRADAR